MTSDRAVVSDSNGMANLVHGEGPQIVVEEVPHAHAPEHLPGATDFSDDNDELNPLWVVTTAKAHPQFFSDLVRATDLNQRPGRKRMPGNWALAYLAYVVSDRPDVEPWWSKAGHSIWRHAGFRERPSKRATQVRFAELEEHADAFERCARKLIAHAVKASDGKVGQYVHVDGTEAEAHTRLVHLCAPGSPCRRKTFETTRGTRTSASVPTSEAQRYRHGEAEQPEPEPIQLTPEEPEPLTAIGEADEIRKTDQGVKVRVGACWYRLLDETAGVRAYTNEKGAKRFWVGYYNHKAVDHYTGAPLAVHVSSASVQEHHSYPMLYDKLTEATGKHPDAIVADRGYSVSSVFEHNTTRGVASVMPWRRPNGSITDREQEDCERWDRHGVLRCKYCGGPTRKVRFNHNGRGGPRLWARCQAPRTADCHKEQTVYCRENWRLLLPLWRTDPTYLALRDSHDRYERVHQHWRARYRVASDHHMLRHKRRGLGCQQLRSNGALIAEWMMILWREGWLGSARRNKRKARRDQGGWKAAKFARDRIRAGLHRQYGLVAQKLDKKLPFRPTQLSDEELTAALAAAAQQGANGAPSDEPHAEQAGARSRARRRE